jgi:uncharacterized membrane protein
MIQMLLVVAYMALTHVAVVLKSDGLALAAVTLLVTIGLLAALRRGRPWAYLLLAATVVVALLSASAPWARIVLFFPPVVVNVALACLFGHTLLGKRVPLVERIVRLLHQDDEVTDPAVWVYARNVTLCWTALFCFNAALCALLALVAEPGGMLAMFGVPAKVSVPTVYWSLFSDAGCYMLTGIMFVVEYQVRRRRFPWQPYRSFFEFMRRAAAIGPALMADLSRRPPNG